MLYVDTSSETGTLSPRKKFAPAIPKNAIGNRKHTHQLEPSSPKIPKSWKGGTWNLGPESCSHFNITIMIEYCDFYQSLGFINILPKVHVVMVLKNIYIQRYSLGWGVKRSCGGKKPEKIHSKFSWKITSSEGVAAFVKDYNLS